MATVVHNVHNYLGSGVMAITPNKDQQSARREPTRTERLDRAIKRIGERDKGILERLSKV